MPLLPEHRCDARTALLPLWSMIMKTTAKLIRHISVSPWH